MDASTDAAFLDHSPVTFGRTFVGPPVTPDGRCFKDVGWGTLALLEHERFNTGRHFHR